MSGCFYNEVGSCWLLKKKDSIALKEDCSVFPNREAKMIVSKKLNYFKIMG